MQYGPKIVTNGLVLCLDAADKNSYSGSGTSWINLSGNSGNGTLTNGPTFNSSNGGTIIFDGTNDYAVTSNINLSNTSAVSVDLWVKILNYVEIAGNAEILFELSNNFNGEITGFAATFGDNSGGASNFPIGLLLKGDVGYNISYFSRTLVNDLNWHHWCCIFDKTQTTQEAFLYIDGVSRTSIPSGYSSNNTNNFGNLPFYIGGRAASLNSNVQLSNIKIYNRVLSASEILQNFNTTKNRFGI